MPTNLPSVPGVARALVSRFERVFGRECVELSAAEGGNEVEELREMVGWAEEEARTLNEAAGGWARAPDLSRSVM